MQVQLPATTLEGSYVGKLDACHPGDATREINLTARIVPLFKEVLELGKQEQALIEMQRSSERELDALGYRWDRCEILSDKDSTASCKNDQERLEYLSGRKAKLLENNQRRLMRIQDITETIRDVRLKKREHRVIEVRVNDQGAGICRWLAASFVVAGVALALNLPKIALGAVVVGCIPAIVIGGIAAATVVTGVGIAAAAAVGAAFISAAVLAGTGVLVAGVTVGAAVVGCTVAVSAAAAVGFVAAGMMVGAAAVSACALSILL